MPDADEQKHDDRIDPRANAKAEGAIRRAGRNIADIVAIIGRPSPEWRVSDLATVRQWLDKNADDS
jgi:hypothetical protein